MWRCVPCIASIHVTYNRVVHRFLVYVASTLLLFGMWAAFVARILS